MAGRRVRRGGWLQDRLAAGDMFGVFDHVCGVLFILVHSFGIRMRVCLVFLMSGNHVCVCVCVCSCLCSLHCMSCSYHVYAEHFVVFG